MRARLSVKAVGGGGRCSAAASTIAPAGCAACAGDELPIEVVAAARLGNELKRFLPVRKRRSIALEDRLHDCGVGLEPRCGEHAIPFVGGELQPPEELGLCPASAIRASTSPSSSRGLFLAQQATKSLQQDVFVLHQSYHPRTIDCRVSRFAGLRLQHLANAFDQTVSDFLGVDPEAPSAIAALISSTRD